MQRSALNQNKAEDVDQNVIIDDEHWVIATPEMPSRQIQRFV